MCLNDESSLPIHSVYCFSLLRGHASFLLLYSSDWDDVHFDHFRSKFFINLNLLLLSEHRLVHLLIQKFDLRRAQLHHASLKSIIRHVGLLFDFSALNVRNPRIEQTKNASLRHVYREEVPFRTCE